MNDKIALIGLGYVGLPLAVEFGKIISVVGFDINRNRISELIRGVDSTLEMTSKDLSESTYLSLTDNVDDIKGCNIYIITVPTPVTSDKQPDLTSLKDASKMIGQVISKNDIVIYESTVYPGATEEICVPILESQSGLKFNKDFYCGYSPERINPGDKHHRLADIIKITSGSTPEVANKIDSLYQTIITAGTHKANSIKIAEAAKVIENTQRDVNIALINELSIIFKKLNIDTEAVLKAAETKWNFLSFRPGLVGGHCIGVDPYYLTYKSLSVGYKPEMILAGRQINDNMGLFVVNQVCDLMTMKKIDIDGSNVLIMGLTFKENCPDLRNTRIVDLILEFKKLNSNVDVYDPWVKKEKVSKELGVSLVDSLTVGKYDAVILAVAHDIFKELSVDEIRALGRDDHILYDLKFLLNANQVDGRL